MGKKHKDGMKNVELLAEKDPGVVSLSAWRLNKELSKKAREYQEYLQLLKTENLMHEVNCFITELKEIVHSNFHTPQLERGKMILQEISERVASSAPELSATINDIGQNLSKKIAKIEHLKSIQ